MARSAVQLASMAKVKGSAAMGAWDAVKAVYDEFAGMSDANFPGMTASP